MQVNDCEIEGFSYLIKYSLMAGILMCRWKLSDYTDSKFTGNDHDALTIRIKYESLSRQDWIKFRCLVRIVKSIWKIQFSRNLGKANLPVFGDQILGHKFRFN